MKQTIKKIALFTVVAILAVLDVQAQTAHNITVVTGSEGTLSPKASPDAAGILSTASSGMKVYIMVESEDYRVDGLPVVKAYTDGGSAQARREAPSILDKVQVTQTSLSQYEFTMPDFDVEISAAFISNKIITENDVEVYWDAESKSDSKVYDGTDAKPTVVVGIKKTNGSVTSLTSGTDYTITWTPGEVKNVSATYKVEVTGANDYTGTVSKTFSITKAPLTITAENKEKVYGEALPTLTAKYEGLVNNETSAVLSNLQIETTATQTTAVGESEITVSAESDNYEITPVAGKLTITQREVVVSGITASDKVYDGTAVATLDLTNAAFAAGNVVGEDGLTIASATGTFVDAEGAADANIGVGKTVKISDITLGGAAVANYKLAAEGQQASTTATISARNIAEAAIAEIPWQVFTGEAIKPELTVTFNEMALKVGTDYTVAYTDSILPGTAKATLTGIGNYTGTNSADYIIYEPSFTIAVGEAEHGTVSVDQEYATNGQEVTVTATPDEDYELVAITVNDEPIEGNTFVMPDQDVTVSATFKRIEYTINIAEAENGKVSASVEKSISGETITVTATADEDYELDKITVDGEAIEGESFVMPKHEVTVSATFKQKEYAIKVAEAENGKVSASAEKSVSGQTITVTAEPDEDYVLDKVTVDGEAIDGESFVMPKHEVTVSATFKQKEYTITVAQPEHGTVSASAEKSISGETITVAATPEEGYYLGSITVNDEAISGNTFAMPKSDVTVSALFKEIGDVSGAVITLDWTSATYSGLAQLPSVTSVSVGETVLDEGDYTVSYSNDNPVDVGAYSLTVTATGENLKGSATATFTIEKATLIAKADNKGFEEGSEMPELTVSFEGFVNNESVDNLKAVPTATTDATAESTPGEYEIVVSGGDAQNYAFEYVNGILTVAKIPEKGEEVTINDESGSKIEGTVTDIKTNEETGESIYEVTLTTVPEDVLNGTAEMESSTIESNGQTFEVTEIEASAFEGLQEGVIVQLPEGVSTTEGVTNVINGDGSCSTLDLTNVEHFDVKQTVTANEVVYNRTVEQAKFSVCLPWEFTLPEGVDAYTLQKGEEGKATFALWGSRILKAFMPYILDVDITSSAARRSVGNTIIDLGTTNAVIDPSQVAESIEKDEVEFCGSITGLTHAEGAELQAFIMQPDYSWQMTAQAEEGSNQYLPPFQAYLRVKSSAGGTTGGGSIESGFDNTTGIRNINAEKFGNNMEGWYDLNGRKLETAPKAKGVYIKDGRKVVVE